MKIKPIWFVLIFLLIGYLIGSTLFGLYFQVEYKKELSHHLLLIGKEGFTNTSQLSVGMKRDHELHRNWIFLQLTPPLGWFIIHRLETLEDSLIFASKNMALPESQRFSDADECRKYGFDPTQKSDDQIINAAFSKF